MALFGHRLVDAKVRSVFRDVSLFANQVCCRDQYKGHVPPYHPTFLDGWSPEYPIIDEIDSNMEKQGYGDPLDNAYNNDYDYQSSSQEIFERNPNDRHPPENQQTIGDSTRSDISVDSIETKGVEERAYGSRSNDSFLDDLLARGANVVHVTYPRTANNDKELTVTRGEYLEVRMVQVDGSVRSKNNHFCFRYWTTVVNGGKQGIVEVK